MNIEKYNKYYGYALFTGAAYYFSLLVLQYDVPYKAWENWAYPNYTSETYAFLFLTYFLNIGVPLIMFTVGMFLHKGLVVKWYMATVFVFFLILSGLVGKVILFVGLCLWSVNKYNHVKNT
jgi:hypothetical protein